MPKLTITLPKPHAAQARVISQAARFNVVDCGRRFGKTQLGLDRAADPAVLTYPVGWFSPTYKMLLEVWREASILFQPIEKRKNAQERRIEFVTGGLLEFWSLDDINAGRGRKYKRVIVDEAAMVKMLMDHWQIVLRSTLADYQGDAWFLSTPKGRNGFWQMWQWGQDPLQPEWASWQMPTHANPFIDKREIEAMRQSMPELVYNQEVMAQFLEDAGGVFRRVVDAATAVPEEKPGPGPYIFGVDWGKMNDFTVIVVLDAKTKRMAYLDRFNQIDYHVQVGRLAALAEKFRPAGIVAERNSMGDPIIEQLQRQGLPVLPFTTTNATKTRAIDELGMAFERGEIEILNDLILVGELQAYEMERLPSGMLRYSAPSGMHDDCVMALAMAWQGVMEMSEPSPSSVVIDDDPVTISPY